MRVTAVGRNANLILVGFMGTGKSSVGRRVAARLGRQFLDFDAVLEARFGRPVSRIFAEEGEAVFRAAEADLCRSLPPDVGLVVATGGGVVVPRANRDALHLCGIVVCLTANPATLTGRLLAEGHGKRPMLGDQPEDAVTRLLAARAAAYAAIPLQVDTSGLDVDTVTERVLAVYKAQLEERETP
jgi:shikimate kinase